MANIINFMYGGKKFTLLGASGRLGKSFTKYLQSQGVSFSSFMLEGFKYNSIKIDSIRHITEGADTLINCVGLVNVEKCEENEEIAYALNFDLPSLLAKACSKDNIELVHISTPSVFSGREIFYDIKSTPDATSVYGKSKYLGEYAIQSFHNDSKILRVNFLGIFQGYQNIARTFIESAIKKNSICAYFDSHFNPTYIMNLIPTILNLACEGENGIHHLVSKEIKSKYHFACEVHNSILGSDSLVLKREFQDVNNIYSRNTSLIPNGNFPHLQADSQSIVQKLISDYVIQSSGQV